MGSFSSIIIIVLMFAAMYFLMIRPQKKQERETNNMRNNLQVGDEITTIGGIIGKIVSIKEETVMIETGHDRTKIILPQNGKKEQYILQTVCILDTFRAVNCPAHGHRHAAARP